MVIESKDDEIIIRISPNVNLEDIQKSLDFIRYKEILSKSNGTQSDADSLAKEINTDWWSKNKDKYISGE
ncbi:MAG TPA: hypothetical protein VGN20_17285 [Mucilaginibacter sp.]|jgi:hypothetical protein